MPILLFLQLYVGGAWPTYDDSMFQGAANATAGGAGANATASAAPAGPTWCWPGSDWRDCAPVTFTNAEAQRGLGLAGLNCDQLVGRVPGWEDWDASGTCYGPFNLHTHTHTHARTHTHSHPEPPKRCFFLLERKAPSPHM